MPKTKNPARGKNQRTTKTQIRNAQILAQAKKGVRVPQNQKKAA